MNEQLRQIRNSIKSTVRSSLHSYYKSNLTRLTQSISCCSYI